MKKLPLVSIVMSVRDGELYLRESIRSILNQKYHYFEFIIVNDASIDKTSIILSKIKDLRIKIITNKRRLGLTRSLNKALSKAEGKYVARMDADDIALPSRILKQVQFLEANTQFGVVGSWVSLIDENNRLRGTIKFPVTSEDIKNRLPFSNVLRHSTVTARRDLLESYGYYDPVLDGAEDYDLWLRLARYTSFYNIPQVLLKYRIHDKRVSNLEEKKVLQAAIKTRLKAITRYNYNYSIIVPLIIYSISYLIPVTFKNTIRKLVFTLFQITVFIMQKTSVFTSIGIRLVKLTNKYKEAVHPKHLTKEGKEWFLPYIKKGDTVLDIGCNNGQNTIKASRRCKKVIGFDFDVNLLELAKRDIKRKRLENIKLLKSNAENKFPFKDNSFDVVLFFAVLEHLINRKQAISEVKRVLKPAGLLLLSVPNSDTFWKGLQKKAQLPYYSDNDHKIEFTKSSITKFLTSNSFSIIRCSPVSFDMPFVGVIDMFGGMSLTIYQWLSLIRRKLVIKYPDQTVSFEIAAQYKK